MVSPQTAARAERGWCRFSSRYHDNTSHSMYFASCGNKTTNIQGNKMKVLIFDLVFISVVTIVGAG